jgi:hypothetical protein
VEEVGEVGEDGHAVMRSGSRDGGNVSMSNTCRSQFRLSRARAFGQRLYRTCQGRWKGVSKGAGPQAMGRAHEEAALRLFPPSTSWPRM